MVVQIQKPKSKQKQSGLANLPWGHLILGFLGFVIIIGMFIGIFAAATSGGDEESKPPSVSVVDIIATSLPPYADMFEDDLLTTTHTPQ